MGIAHRALATCIRSLSGLLGPAGRRVANTTKLTFDIAMAELFLPLTTGGCALLATEDERSDPSCFADWVARTSPSLVQATPTAWRMYLPAAGSLLSGVTRLCGGEQLTGALAAELRDCPGEVWNVYGPTEATVWCTAYRLSGAVPDPVPVGRPFPGTAVHVLDDHLDPVPPGEPGLLHISGPQLAQGYVGDPERTAQSFLHHPTLGRIYDTGDLGHRRPDGDLECRGRVDDQVKLRGHRLELGEVERIAERCAGVTRAAAVLARDARGEQQLVVYVEDRPDGRLPEADLWTHLEQWLPAAVLPQRIVRIPAMPCTPNGKLDRRVLRSRATADVGPVRPPDPSPQEEARSGRE